MPPQHPQHKKHQVPQRLLKGMMVSSSWFRARFISLAWLEDPTTWHLVIKKHTQPSYTGDKYWQMIFNVCINIYLFLWKKSFLAQNLTRHILLRLNYHCRLSGFRSFSQVASRFSCCSWKHGLHKYQLQYKMFCFPFLATNRCWNHKNGKNDAVLQRLAACTHSAQQLKTHHKFSKIFNPQENHGLLISLQPIQLLAIGDAAVVTGTL